MTYQQPECGSRYCQNCYDELESKFYCDDCKIDNLERFNNNDMESKNIQCPDCKMEYTLSNLESHIKDCPEGWIKCSTCDFMIKKKLKHFCEGKISSLAMRQSDFEKCLSCGKECLGVNKRYSECTNCPFGCECEVKNLANHREENHLFHLDKAWAILKSNNLTEITKEETPELKKIVEKVVDNLKKSLGIEINEVFRLSQELISLTEAIREEISIYESIKSSFKSQISDSLYTSFDGRILWRIDHFREVKEKAQSEIQESIFSPPFYTSKFGYKMCLRLYPYGDSTAKGEAMSLFLVIMKGNYDSLLTWPFKQKVTFILLDQEFKANMIDAFVPGDDLPSFAMPMTNMNIPSGSSYFIKFEDMKLHKYVKDDTIFIRCIIDCSDLHD